MTISGQVNFNLTVTYDSPKEVKFQIWKIAQSFSNSRR